MGRRISAICLLLRTIIVLAVTPGGICNAGPIWSDLVNFSQVEGPYSYKNPNDLIEVIGFITQRTGDSADFRDCKGTIRKVKFADLVRVQRPCSGKGGGGIWVLDSFGKIILMDSESKTETQNFLGTAQIDTTDIPESYREVLKGAKAGDLVAVSSKAGGKLDISLIKKPPEGNVPQK
jgi:hypothetical protein